MWYGRNKPPFSATLAFLEDIPDVSAAQNGTHGSFSCAVSMALLFFMFPLTLNLLQLNLSNVNVMLDNHKKKKQYFILYLENKV